MKVGRRSRPGALRSADAGRPAEAVAQCQRRRRGGHVGSGSVVLGGSGGPACADADAAQSRRWIALIGALVQQPDLLEPWRDLIAPARAEDRAEGTDPVAASIVRLAADGLWLADVLGTQPFGRGQRRKVIERLRAMTSEAPR